MSTYHFDQFCFTAHERILRRRDPTGGVVSIPLGGRALDVLLVLLRHNQRVVSKREIMGAVWSDFTPTDNNLAVHISLLRRALDEGRQGSSLIRTVSGRGYSLAAEVRAATADGAPDIVAAGDTGAPPASHVRPTGPVIAVLPFTNMSSDPEHDDLADGLMDDLITEISRRGWGLIVARNSIFTYKGRTGDVKQLGRELGTRYVLEGSVRKAGTRVRITAQLVDAATGSHLWADRFEGTLGNILDLPDRIATKVVLAIVPQLERSETERIRRKPTDSYDAYDCYVIGLASARQWTKEGLSEAQRLFYKAIELDPDFARPYGMAAICYSQRKASGWTTDPTAEIAETARLSGRAIALGRDDADALALGGFGYVYVIGDIDLGTACIDRAIELNPNLSLAYHLSGWTRIFLGEPDLALEHLACGFRLSPGGRQVSGIQAATAFGHFFAGRYELACSWAERSVREQPYHPRGMFIYAAAHVVAGRMPEARRAVASLREPDPACRVSDLRHRMPLRRHEDAARFADALRKAGLPD